MVNCYLLFTNAKKQTRRCFFGHNNKPISSFIEQEDKEASLCSLPASILYKHKVLLVYKLHSLITQYQIKPSTIMGKLLTCILDNEMAHDRSIRSHLVRFQAQHVHGKITASDCSNERLFLESGQIVLWRDGMDSILSWFFFNAKLRTITFQK